MSTSLDELFESNRRWAAETERRAPGFFTKLLAALLVLIAFPGFQLAWAVFGHAVARESLEDPFHWNILLGALLSQLQLMLTFLTVGTLLGFARSLTWMLVGVAAAALQRLIHFVPRAAMLDPLRLVESGVEGVRWRYDSEVIVAQFIVATVCALLAWALFHRAGRSRTVIVNPRMAAAFTNGQAADIVLGQAGFAVMDIVSFKDTMVGQGIIKILEEETNNETVTLVPVTP